MNSNFVSDVNECVVTPCKCARAPNSPGCSVNCTNLIGSYKCLCSKGYHLSVTTCIGKLGLEHSEKPESIKEWFMISRSAETNIDKELILKINFQILKINFRRYSDSHSLSYITPE